MKTWVIQESDNLTAISGTVFAGWSLWLDALRDAEAIARAMHGAHLRWIDSRWMSDSERQISREPEAWSRRFTGRAGLQHVMFVYPLTVNQSPPGVHHEQAI